MAKKVAVFVTGTKRLNRKLAKLATTDARKIVRKASREALKPVLAAARANAPKDSGLLKKSLTIRALKRSRKGIGHRVTTRQGMFAGETFYGGFQEWGWKAGKRSSRKRKPIEGTKFMRKAADQKRNQALAIYRRLIARGIIEAAKKG